MNVCNNIHIILYWYHKFYHFLQFFGRERQNILYLEGETLNTFLMR